MYPHSALATTLQPQLPPALRKCGRFCYLHFPHCSFSVLKLFPFVHTQICAGLKPQGTPLQPPPVVSCPEYYSCNCIWTFIPGPQRRRNGRLCVRSPPVGTVLELPPGFQLTQPWVFLVCFPICPILHFKLWTYV